MAPIITKICKKCGIAKSADLFTKDPRNRDGLGAKCRSCYNVRQRELYPSRPIKRPKGSKEYENHRKWNKKWTKTFKGWLSVILIGCRKRYECNLTKEDVISLWNKQKGLCAMTGQPMDYTANSRAYNKPSIDRIDSLKGYHLGNVRLVWHFVNQAKNIYTDEQLVEFCRLIVFHNERNKL